MSGNYPAGLTDWSPNTPWNVPSVPECDFEIEATYTMTCARTVTTDNYIPIYDEDCGATYTDTTDTYWEDEFEEQHFTPMELIEKLKQYLNNDPALKEKTTNGVILRNMLKECEGWTVSDKEFEEV